MKTLNIAMGLMILVLSWMLIASVSEVNPKQRFEYGSFTMGSGMDKYTQILAWSTGAGFFSASWKITSSGNVGLDFIHHIQDLVRQLGGNPEQANRVETPIGFLDFVGEQGWELVSYFSSEGSTTYLFKRLQ